MKTTKKEVLAMVAWLKSTVLLSDGNNPIALAELKATIENAICDFNATTESEMEN